MKNMKKIATVIAVVGVVGMASLAYAADIKSPADITSALTGKTVEAVQQEKLSGKTYGEIAKDEGKLAEFKDEILGQKKVILDQKVEDGALTQEEADEIYNKIVENQEKVRGQGLDNGVCNQ
jgi:hypothetical protein